MLRSTLLLLTIALAHLPAARAEHSSGGGGGIDHGGGGTFVVRTGHPQPVFWDLFLLNPVINDRDAGDTITLDAASEQDGGEWLAPRKARRSLGYLGERLALWKPRFPTLVAALEQGSGASGIVATKLKITSVSQLAVPRFAPRSGDDFHAVPGAFIDYSTGVVFLDVNVWNQAGLLSQAALLLHEQLRRLQLRYELTNDDLQSLVSTLILKNPDSWPGGDWRLQERADASAVAASSRSAAEELADAERKGYLGTTRAGGAVRASGSQNEVPDEAGHVVIQPVNCQRELGEILGFEAATSSLTCREGDLVGSGRLRFHDPFRVELKPETSAAFSFDGAQLAFDLLKENSFDAAPGELVTFTRLNAHAIRVRVGTKSPVSVTVDVPRPENVHTYGVRLSRKRNVIEAFTIVNDGFMDHETVIAKIPLTRRYDDPEKHIAWNLVMSGGTNVRFLRVTNAYAPEAGDYFKLLPRSR